MSIDKTHGDLILKTLSYSLRVKLHFITGNLTMANFTKLKLNEIIIMRCCYMYYQHGYGSRKVGSLFSRRAWRREAEETMEKEEKIDVMPLTYL